MTIFLRLLHDADKASAMAATSWAVRQGREDARVFGVEPEAFQDVPGAPFAYWVSERVRGSFARFAALESSGRQAQVGASTKDDFRFVRTFWEPGVLQDKAQSKWACYAKGGTYSKYYSDVHLLVNWKSNGIEIEALVAQRYPYLNGNTEWVMHRESRYGSPGLTWPTRTSSGLGFRILPRGCVFAVKGSSVFIRDDDPDSLLLLLAITTSSAFEALVDIQIASGGVIACSYEVGVIQRTPVPRVGDTQSAEMGHLALLSWSLKRTLDTVSETSHAFLLPALLRSRLGEHDPSAIETELARIQNEIDDMVIDLYGFDEADRTAMRQTSGAASEAEEEADAADQDDGDEPDVPTDAQADLLSWCVGVAFGRFDVRLATGEREAPPEPDPFDPLPIKSPGMLPDGAEPFHAHAGILVDDKGDPHDLTDRVEDVLMKVGMPVPDKVREWLQHDFFAFHLQRYSKSRRKAPIYWPLSTSSGSYTLWVYYPSLTSQTLYTAVNDFVDPKLKQVATQQATLRAKGKARSGKEEQQLEEAQSLEEELTDLHDALLKTVREYHPDQDDGVQITAAPLWPLFRHKPWQKLLKETWTKLEKGDYDWAHLALHYWPDRVREKCMTDKSLAIAHGLEDLYAEPEVQARKARTRRQ